MRTPGLASLAAAVALSAPCALAQPQAATPYRRAG
jgi:hypothetical protein